MFTALLEDVCAAVDALADVEAFPAACALGDGDVVDDVHPAVHATRIIKPHKAAMRYVRGVFMLNSDLRGFRGAHSTKVICFATGKMERRYVEAGRADWGSSADMCFVRRAERFIKARVAQRMRECRGH
jgi:hypothetical protein